MAPRPPLSWPSPDLVGRERELAALSEALTRRPAVVLVAGEAGIGKSRLIRECLAAPAAGRSPALVVRCPPYHGSLTLGPVVDAVLAARDRTAGLRLSPLAGALRPLFPEWAGTLPPAPDSLDDPGAARHRLFRALAELVDQLCDGLLVVEDAHWADRATLEFVLFLAARQRPAALLVTFRPEDVPPGSLLLRLSSWVPSGTRAARLTLPPLDPAGTSRLMSSMLDGEPVSEPLVALLHSHTDGIPLAVEESVRLLRDRDDLVHREGRWWRRGRDRLDVPPTVRDAVRERLQRVRPPAQSILESAAVLADPAPEALLREVAQLSGEQAGAGVAEALASGLLAEDGRRLAFRHELMRWAVYEAIPAPRRRLRHLAAGTVLESADPVPVARLARHFREAQEFDRWCRYAELTADQAAAANDHTAAVTVLHEVLSGATLPVRRRARLASRLAHAALGRGEPVDRLSQDVVRTLRSVRDLPQLDPVQRAEVRNPLGRLLMQLGDWQAGYRELESAATNLAHDPVQAARAMTYLGMPFVGPAPARVHRRWLRRAAEITPALVSPVDRIGLTGDRATALVLLGDEEGWRVGAALPTTGQTRQERRVLARVHANLAAGAMLWGRYPDAGARLALARELVEPSGDDKFRYLQLGQQVLLDLLVGAWDGLAGRLATLLDTGPEVRPNYSGALYVAGSYHAAQGAAEKAESYFRRALETARGRGLLDDAQAAAGGLGRLRLGEGRVDEALQVTEEPVRMMAAKGIWLWATEVAPVRVAALVAAGRTEEAARLVATFARGLRDRDAPAPRAALATCRAVLAAAGEDRWARAAAAYSRAASAWERLPRPYEGLLARERQAGCLIAAGESGTGVAQLSEVYQGFARLGAGGDATRVLRELRGHGVEVRHRLGGRPGYGGRLSPRELEVVRLLVTGRTDRQIAAELFLSPRTVGRHLESARHKLQVPSRTALAVAVVEAGLAAELALAGAGGAPGSRR